MPIYHDGKKMKPYRGYRKPVNVYYGDKKVAGWKKSTQTGNNLTFQTTYNDTADVVVKGKSLQKSEWVHKQGLLSQFTGVAGTNLVANGNFAGGINSWYGSGANITASGNELTVIPTVETPNVSTARQDLSVVSGNKYYIAASVKASYTNVFVTLYDGTTVHYAPMHSGSGNYERLSAVVTSGNTTSAAHMQIIRDSSSGTRQPSYAKNGIIINLTAAFGAGNEPTAAQVDSMLSQHPNSWFDVKGNLTTSTSYTANSPSPAYPQPLISNLPAGTYKTQDWRGDWYEFTLTKDLAGIDSVRDSVEWDKYSHTGRLINNWYNGTLDLSTKIFAKTGSAWQRTGYFSGYVSGALPYKSVGFIPGRIDYCDMLRFGNWEWSGNPDPYNYFLCGNNNNIFYFILPLDVIGCLEEDSDATKLAASKALFTNNPPTVAYQLATPTRTPLTFTRNDNSTAPECPMEFLTDTPSGEYPAEVYDAQGSVGARGVNLITNGNFANGSTGWNLNGCSFDTIESNELKVNSDPTAPTPNITQTINNVMPGDKIYMSCYARANVNTTKITLNYRDVAQNKTIVAQSLHSLWTNLTIKQRYSGIIEVPSEITNPLIQVAYNHPTAEVGQYCYLSNIMAVNLTTAFGLGNEPTKAQCDIIFAQWSDNKPIVTAPIPALRSVNEVKDTFNVRTGVLTRRIGRIESYNGEEVGDNWVSSTGALDIGATVVYELAQPIEEQYDPVTLPTYYPTTVITTTNNTPAELETTTSVKVEDEE